MSTKIEWTDETWNPITGCTRVSEGCRNCYAERMSARIVNMGGKGAALYEGTVKRQTDKEWETVGWRDVDGKALPAWTGKIRFHPDRLEIPLRWRKPRRVFVCSMSDLFHEKVSDERVAAIFGVMGACPDHTFQVLTKRPGRAGSLLRNNRFNFLYCWSAVDHCNEDPGWPLPNVWLGTSVEDQATADERIPHLLACPAAVRFVSYEPALGPVSFARWMWPPLHPLAFRDTPIGQPRLDWIILGAESGPGARPCNAREWFPPVLGSCRAAGVAAFVKQLCINGRKIPFGKWPAELQVRQWP